MVKIRKDHEETITEIFQFGVKTLSILTRSPNAPITLNLVSKSSKTHMTISDRTVSFCNPSNILLACDWSKRVT